MFASNFENPKSEHGQSNASAACRDEHINHTGSMVEALVTGDETSGSSSPARKMATCAPIHPRSLNHGPSISEARRQSGWVRVTTLSYTRLAEEHGGLQRRGWIRKNMNTNITRNGTPEGVWSKERLFRLDLGARSYLYIFFTDVFLTYEHHAVEQMRPRASPDVALPRRSIPSKIKAPSVSQVPIVLTGDA